MQISQENFKKVIEVVYKRGVVRRADSYISDSEVKYIIADVYDYLNFLQSADKAVCAKCEQEYSKPRGVSK